MVNQLKLYWLMLLVCMFSCSSVLKDNRLALIEKYSLRIDHYLASNQFDSALTIADYQIQVDTINPIGYFNKGLLFTFFMSERQIDSARFYFSQVIRLSEAYECNQQYLSKRIDAELFLKAMNESVLMGDSVKANTYIWTLPTSEKKDSIRTDPDFSDIEF